MAHPALWLPCGPATGNLPVGLQLVGRWHEDEDLLDVAARIEASFGFPSAILSQAGSLIWHTEPGGNENHRGLAFLDDQSIPHDQAPQAQIVQDGEIVEVNTSAISHCPSRTLGDLSVGAQGLSRRRIV